MIFVKEKKKTMKRKNLFTIPVLALAASMLFACAPSGGGGTDSREPTKYTVTFYNGNDVYATQKVEEHELATKPATDPQKDGYQFQGWFTAAEGGEEWVFTVNEIVKDTNLYAQYKQNAINYTVNLLVGDTVVETKTTDSDTKADIVLPAVTVAEGKSLLGYGKTAGATVDYVDYRVGATLPYADVAKDADANHVLNLHAIVKDGAIVRLNVGVWGRYILENDFKTFYGEFEKHAKTMNLVYDFLDYTYFAGQSGEKYNKIKDYTAELKKDTTITVAFPTGSNFISSKDSAFNGETIALHEPLGAKKGGMLLDDGRYISRWGTDDVSVAFTDWVLTADALKILDPTYVPPKPYPVEDASETKLVIGVWGRFLTKEHADAVLDAYKAYATKENIAYDDAKIEYYTGATNTDTYFNKGKYLEAIGGNPAIDVIIPVGSNAVDPTDTDVQKYEIDKKLTTVVNLGKDDEGTEGLGLNIEGNDTRWMATLNADTLTVSFLNFINTDEGKVALDPDYGKEPETTPQSDLVISYYGKYISEENAKKVTAQIKKYFTDNSITFTTVEPDYVEGDLKNQAYIDAMDVNANMSLFGKAEALIDLFGEKAITNGQLVENGAGAYSGRRYFTFDKGELTVAAIDYLTSTAGQTFLQSLGA